MLPNAAGGALQWQVWHAGGNSKKFRTNYTGSPFMGMFARSHEVPNLGAFSMMEGMKD
jgi:hypothetical protein